MKPKNAQRWAFFLISLCFLNHQFRLLLSGRPWVRIPPGRPKQATPNWGSLALSLSKGFEPCPVVNGAPVALQSRALSEPAGECEDPAGEALFAAAQVISKKRSPDGSVLDRKHRGEERIRCPAVRRRPSAHRPFRVPARAWPALCPTARPPGRSCSRSSRSPGTSPYSQSAPAARRGIPA